MEKILQFLGGFRTLKARVWGVENSTWRNVNEQRGDSSRNRKWTSVSGETWSASEQPIVVVVVAGWCSTTVADAIMIQTNDLGSRWYYNPKEVEELFCSTVWNRSFQKLNTRIFLSRHTAVRDRIQYIWATTQKVDDILQLVCLGLIRQRSRSKAIGGLKVDWYAIL